MPLRKLKLPDMKLVEVFDPYKLFTSREENLRSRRKAIRSFKAQQNAKRKPSERFADWVTNIFGSIPFMVIHIIWFGAWILINTDKTPLEPFDPFPFGLLTTVVSLEAIFLAIIVLISQNREARVTEIRDEIDLHINTLTESEITKIISLLVQIMEKQGIKVEDKELHAMLRPTDTNKIEEEIESELNGTA